MRPGFETDAEMEAHLQALVQRAGPRRPALGLGEAVAIMEGGDPLEADLALSGAYGDVDFDTSPSNERYQEGLRMLGHLMMRLREDAIEKRWGVDENTLLNMAFRLGHHYVEVDRSRRAVLPVPAPRDQVRRTVQKFEPWFRQQSGRLSQGLPAYQVEATARQQEDHDAAEFGDAVAESERQSMFTLENRSEVVQWKILGGVAIWHEYVEWVEDPEYMMGSTVGPDGQPQQVAAYKPVCRERILSGLQTWLDIREKSIEKARWIGYDDFAPMAEAIALYPEHTRHLLPEDLARSRGRSYLRRMQRMLGGDDRFRGTIGDGTTVASVDEEEETTICRFFLRPGASLMTSCLEYLAPYIPGARVVRGEVESGGYPVVTFAQGLYVAFTPDGYVLEVTENIYDGLPFREMRFSKSPTVYGYAPATPMRELQMAKNWTMSMREQHVIKTSAAPLLIDRLSGFSRRGNLFSAFAKIFYRGRRQGGVPQYLNPPPMGVDVEKLDIAIEAAWMEVGGIHEVSRAELPTADKLSGIAISLLQEQDLQQLGYAGEEQEAAYVDILRMRLRNIQRFYPSNDPRLVKLAGDAQFKLQAFMQADLRGGLDIRVVNGSALPRSPAATEAKFRELWELGALVDRWGNPDWRRMLTAYGLADESELNRELEIDTANARAVEEIILRMDELQLMLVWTFIMNTGSLPELLMPRPEDDPFVHEREHRIRLKRLQRDPRANPYAVEILRTRWSLFVQIAAQGLATTAPEVLMGAQASALLAPGQQEEQGEQGGQGGAPEEQRAAA